MGIQRSNRHKRTKTGGKKGISHKKRKHALARQPSNTRIGIDRVRDIRVRGGNKKQRALRLSAGVFTLNDLKAKADIQIVMYHPTNTELMRTNTITKSAIVKIHSEELLNQATKMDGIISEQAKLGNLYGIVESRPGQVGNADGRVLFGDELDFYMDKFKKKKAKIIKV